MKMLYVVGRLNSLESIDQGWELLGVFSEVGLAEAECRSDIYFVGPVELDKAFPHKSVKWEGAYHPTVDPRAKVIEAVDAMEARVAAIAKLKTDCAKYQSYKRLYEDVFADSGEFCHFDHWLARAGIAVKWVDPDMDYADDVLAYIRGAQEVRAQLQARINGDFQKKHPELFKRQ